MEHILAIDQSTSATKAILFGLDDGLRAKTSIPHRQIYPKPGWVERDPAEIYNNTIQVIRDLMESHPDAANGLLCLSISNQRETIVVFEKGSGRPLHNAFAWQCRRGDPICSRLVNEGHGEQVRQSTGLKIDTCFPASKPTWLFGNHPDILELVRTGKALIDTYLIYRLTGGLVHATDHTNANRTLFYDIRNLKESVKPLGEGANLI